MSYRGCVYPPPAKNDSAAKLSLIVSNDSVQAIEQATEVINTQALQVTNVNPTEEALNKIGFSLTNTFKISVK